MAILGEVFSIIRNGASIKQIDGANGFPITRIETISNRVIDRNRLGYANVFDITEYESYVLQSGDILMSHINSEKHLGKTALYIKKGNEKIIHGMNLLMLRANSEVILPLYAKYFFDSNLFLKQIPNITKKSVNQASFTVTALKKIEIKIPQMVEQKKIIDIMSRLDNIIQYRKNQLEKLDLFIKSRFIEMFGENKSKNHFGKLSDVCLDIIAGGDRPNEISYEQTEEYCYPVFANARTNNGLLYYAKSYKIASKAVTIAARGATVGFTAIRDSYFTPIVRLITLIPNKSMNVYYMKYYIDYNLKIVSSGSAQPQLTVPYIKNLKILIPTSDMQNQFASFVMQVDKSKLAIQQSLDELETLKKSLMQQYFG